MERKEIMKEIIDEKNNKIIGNINLDNSKVKFTGSNNILYINDEITLVNSSIDFRGDNSLVYLCKTAEKITVDIKLLYIYLNFLLSDVKRLCRKSL